MNKSHRRGLTKRGMILRLVMMLGLMLICSQLMTGCETVKVVQVPSDYMVVTVKKGVPFTPPENGKFVPDAQWRLMLDVYIRASNAK